MWCLEEDHREDQHRTDQKDEHEQTVDDSAEDLPFVRNSRVVLLLFVPMLVLFDQMMDVVDRQGRITVVLRRRLGDIAAMVGVVRAFHWLVRRQDVIGLKRGVRAKNERRRCVQIVVAKIFGICQ